MKAGNIIIGDAIIPALNNNIAMIVVTKESIINTSKNACLIPMIKTIRKKETNIIFPIKYSVPITEPIPIIWSSMLFEVSIYEVLYSSIILNPHLN